MPSYDHGRHWYFLAALGDPQQRLRSIFSEMIAGKSLAVPHGDLIQLIDSEAELRCSFLLRGQEFLTAYPIAESGYTWPMQVHDVHTWPSDVEAHLIASCHGARVCFFDAQYFRHRQLYQEQPQQNFAMAGLGYRLYETIFESAEQEQKLGDTKAYFPVGEDEGGEPDEIKFMSHVEGIREVNFWGIPLFAYTVTLALPDDFPMRLDVFAHATACDKAFSVGDRISGFAWLFGSAVSAGAD